MSWLADGISKAEARTILAFAIVGALLAALLGVLAFAPDLRQFALGALVGFGTTVLEWYFITKTSEKNNAA